jgi:uncharacterized membrane protein (UPF0127 family)
MKLLSFLNPSKAAVIGDRIAVADTFLTRLMGLMGKRTLAAGGGLWIVPSSGVHTCWMRMNIDVIAMDRDLKVVRTGENVKPWRISGLSARTHSILELPAGHIRRCGIQAGDRLAIATPGAGFAGGENACPHPE